jgi:hypothetical protein
MPNIQVPAVNQAFAANGGATGSIQVASSAGFYVGCYGYIGQASDPGHKVIIVSIPDATHVIVRIVADDNEMQQSLQRYGGGSNLSTYTTTNSAYIAMPAQLAQVDPSVIKPLGLNV